MFKIKLKPTLFIWLRHTVCCLLYVLIALNAGAQNYSKLYSKKVFNTPLYKALHNTEDFFGVRFYYKAEWMKDKMLNQEFQDAGLETFLIQALPEQGFSWLIIQDSNIVLMPETNKPRLASAKYEVVRIGNPVDKGKYKKNMVKGRVLDGKSQEAVPGAMILCHEHKIYTTTDANGNYHIELPIGLTELEFSYIGLETKAQKVDIMSHGEFNVELFAESITLDDVVVTGYGSKSNLNKTQMGMLQMDIRTIGNLPVMMGEADIVKSMTMMPGVQSGGEMSSGFNVRGGNTDQNLVTIDGVPIYNTSHLFGMFSTFLPATVSRVDLHKGTQSAEFGGRASSVMNIHTIEGDTTKHSGELGIGLLNSQGLIQGPLRKGKISYVASARSTYSNWMLKKTHDINIRNSETWFYDAFGKFTWHLSPNSKVNAFAYQSYDHFSYAAKNDFSYGSLLSGLQWKRRVSQQLNFSAAVNYSKYFNESADREQAVSSFVYQSGIEQYSGKVQARYFYNNSIFTAGIEGSKFSIHPGKQSKTSEESAIKEGELSTENAMEIAGFIQSETNLFSNWSISAGLRYSWFSRIGPASVNVYEEGKPKNQFTFKETLNFEEGERLSPMGGIEPRVGLKYSLSENTKLKAAYALNRQYLHLISNSTLLSPNDFWKASDQHIKPITANIASVGIFSILPVASLECSMELYYKTTSNQLDYKNGAELFMNPFLEQELVATEGRSYGAEMLVKKQFGAFTGWVGYTLSKAEWRSSSELAEEQINEGNYYNSPMHKLHDLTITGNYQISRRWSFGANFVYNSGRPKTLPEQKYTINGLELVQYSERNKYRLPDYHRMDVSLTFKGNVRKTAKVHPSFVLSVYNVYGRKNVYTVHYKKPQSLGYATNPANELYKFSVIGIPLPSLTIKLNF